MPAQPRIFQVQDTSLFDSLLAAEWDPSTSRRIPFRREQRIEQARILYLKDPGLSRHSAAFPAIYRKGNASAATEQRPGFVMVFFICFANCAQAFLRQAAKFAASPGQLIANVAGRNAILGGHLRIGAVAFVR